MIAMTLLSAHAKLTATRTKFSVVLFWERTQNPDLGVMANLVRQSKTEVSSAPLNVTWILLSDAQKEDLRS